MLELFLTKFLVIHIISVMVAVGTVTVTDYLHILGLKDSKIEKKTHFVFPHLSKLIWIALFLVYLSGIAMIIAKPSYLQNMLFKVKMTLVFLVTVNGLILHKLILPKFDRKVKSKSAQKNLIKQAAFFGSFSIVTWYSIVILSITKDIGYTPFAFTTFYILAFVIAYLVAVYVELNKEILK